MIRTIHNEACKSCPAYPKCTALYRGKMCRALRSSHGLGDPMTNADRIRAMSDKELAALLSCTGCQFCGFEHEPNCTHECEKNTLEWLKRPIEEV